MSVPKPSALQVALLRAAHQLLDQPPVFDDPMALRVLGPDLEAGLRADLGSYDTPLQRGVRIAVALRSRIAADAWAQARARGISQYVVLGAGLDTTAHVEHAGGHTILEVDLPQTQRWKREWLRHAGVPEPSCVRYVPVDFSQTHGPGMPSTLTHALSEAGFEAARPAQVSWLGVTMYLEPAAVEVVLRWAASLGAGSGLVFDYAVAPQCLTEDDRRVQNALSGRTARKGEPWKGFFDPAEIKNLLLAQGFGLVDDLGPQEVFDTYLKDRADGLRKSAVTRICRAQV